MFPQCHYEASSEKEQCLWLDMSQVGCNTIQDTFADTIRSLYVYFSDESKTQYEGRTSV